MKLWGKKDFPKVLKNFDFHKILETDRELRDWLETLAIYGIAMIKNTPLTIDETRKIADRVGFIRKTHYGEEFVVQNKEGTSNVAYLSQNLQMHTDLPYYEYKPGTNLLHCLVQCKSNGGDNTISDGFFVAKLMQENFPDYYRVLTETLVNWFDVGQESGNEFHSIYRAPVIW
jgi:gamma-butyrobetaine dioxygenase